MEKKFRTKTGYCHILPDRIVLSRNGVIGEASNAVSGNSMGRLLLLYAGFSVFFFYQSYVEFNKDNLFLSFIYLTTGLFLAYNCWISRNLSAATEIQRSSIEKVSFIKAVPYLTRSRFVVLFKAKNGKMLQRLIMLPGSLSGGADETEKALDIFKSENLI